IGELPTPRIPTQGLAPSVSPERYRLLSGDHLRLSPPAPPVREPSPVVSREPGYSAGRQTRVILQIPTGETTVPQDTIASQPESAASSAMANVAVPYRDVLESIREEVEQAEPRPRVGARISAIGGALAVFFTKRQTVAATMGVTLALLALAATKGRAWGESDQTSTSAGAANPQLTTSATEIPAVTASALTVPIRDAASLAASAASKTTAPKPAAVKPHVDDRPVTRKAEEPSRSDNKKVSVPTLSSSVMSHLDSVVSRAGATSAPQTFTVQPTAIAFGTQRSTFEAGEQISTGPMRARLIGELPTPRIPTQAAEIEGEVRVRFTVDPLGHPAMSSFSVVTSPSPLLTAAVRKVIPEMHFDPARTGGADSRAISDVVETSFRFAMNNR
ncbi:MAG TPA: hypothetical protein VLJ83_03175, partial [Gemmatimonadaceae bacterium]|nr:hypothetical protein [Gemmatimonadaceae bacterium]